MRCLRVGIFFTACYWACTIFGYTGLAIAPRINWRRFSATFHGNLTIMRRPKSRLGFGLVGCLEKMSFMRRQSIAWRRSFLEWRGGPVSMKRLTALIVVLLVALATCEAVVAVLGSSHRLPVVLTGAGSPLQGRSGGIDEVVMGTARPFVAYTLVLLNNTLIPGNFLAENGLLPVAVAYDSGKGEGFVANSQSNTLSGISDTTNTVRATIPGGAAPHGVADECREGEVFVANALSNNVSVISDTTNTVLATIPVGSHPVGMAYDPGTGEVFVANSDSGNVSVISDATNAVVASIVAGSYPLGMAYDAGKGEVFVANSNSGNVSVISDATNTVVVSVAVGSIPYSVAYDAGKGEVFVANS